MKVSELTDALLDAWVAKANPSYRNVWAFNEPDGSLRGFSPSSDWSIGGPIIECESISIETGYMARMVEWRAMVGDAFGGNWPSEKPQFTGPTPLIAAMRAYVASKFGEEVPE